MRLQRQLNIDNTYRVLNLNFFKYFKLSNVVIVTPQNKAQVLQALNDNNGTKYTFLVDPYISMDLSLNHKVYRSNGKIIYHSRSLIPMSAFLDIGTNRKVIYVYDLQDFSKELLQNIGKAAIVGTVAIFADNIDTKVSPNKLIFEMNDVRFLADRFYMNFNPSVTIAEKEHFFDILHEVLARWTLQLFLSYNNEKEHQVLKKEIINKYK